MDAASTASLLRMTAAGRFDTGAFVTHRFGLDDMQDAYDVFASPAETGALKVAMFCGPIPPRAARPTRAGT